MTKRTVEHRYALCVKNRGYAASLETRKIYRVLKDEKAAANDLVRIVDETGEDYLYPTSFFVAIELPKTAARMFSRAG